MAFTDYVVTPRDAAQMVRWFGWRGFFSLIAGCAVGAGFAFIVEPETGVFAGLLVFWLSAGYSGRVFFGCAVVLLIAIMGLSLYDSDYEIADLNVVERLAVWVFYFMAIGVLHYFFQSVEAIGKPAETGRQILSILPTATLLQAKNNDQLLTPTDPIKEEPKKPVQKKTPVPDTKAPSNSKHITPRHPAYPPTQKRIKRRPRGPIQL